MGSSIHTGKCGEKSCPKFCLCLEACCCFASSVAATRYLIQDEMGVANTKCDNCLIATMILLQQLACICELVACITGNQDLQEIAQCIRCIADLFWCSVCACMQTQHKYQVTYQLCNGRERIRFKALVDKGLPFTRFKIVSIASGSLLRRSKMSVP